MVMTSNHNLDALEVIFGFQGEYRYHYEVFFTKDEFLNRLGLVKGCKTLIRSLIKGSVMEDHKSFHNPYSMSSMVHHSPLSEIWAPL